jgi:cyanophycin synthetase
VALRIVERTAFEGPNRYAGFPVVRLLVDLGEAEEWPTGRLGPGFVDGLLAALPGLREHRCSYGVPGGFVRRLTEGEGTWLGHVLEHAALEIQHAAGARVKFGKTRSAGACGRYEVVYECRDTAAGLAAGEAALRLLLGLLPPELRGGADGAASEGAGDSAR